MKPKSIEDLRAAAVDFPDVINCPYRYLWLECLFHAVRRASAGDQKEFDWIISDVERVGSFNWIVTELFGEKLISHFRGLLLKDLPRYKLMRIAMRACPKKRKKK